MVPVFVLAGLIAISSSFTAFAASQEVQISGFTLVHEGEAGRWEISASEATYARDALIEMRKVGARLSQGENLMITVEGPVGRFDPGRKLLTMEDGVQINTSSGYSFSASRLIWDSEGSFIKASGNVTFRNYSMTVRSNSLVHRIDSEMLEMDGGVRARWKPGEGGK